MARYVHAEYLLDKFEKVANDNKGINRQFAKGLREAIQTVINAPSADVEPVVHGGWVDPVIDIMRCLCSNCRQEADNNFDYCPNCGAKMKGD